MNVLAIECSCQQGSVAVLHGASPKVASGDGGPASMGVPPVWGAGSARDDPAAAGRDACSPCLQPSEARSVLQGAVLIKSWEFESPRGRGAGLFAHLESALRECGRVDRVVVGTGPGGYNGLRLSISAAWGIATARGAKLAGVPSLLGYDAAEYFVAGDARAGQWFLARVADGKFLSPPALMASEEAREMLQPGIPVFTTSCLNDLPEAVVAAPSAAILAARDCVEGLPVPLYLKPPHITKPAAL